MEWIDITIGIIVLIVILYYWSSSTFDFWEARGIVGPSPKPFFGNISNIFLGKISLAEQFKMIYDDYPDEPIVGVFMGREPTLILKDLEIITNVLVRDFSTFPSHGSGTFNNIDGPLSEHLFNLEVTRWRPLRSRLSSAFTSGKLKKMFYILLQCGEHLEDKLSELTMNGDQVVECRKLMSKYTIDVVGNCIFGLEINCLDDVNSDFHKICHDVFAPDWKKIIKSRMRQLTPRLFRLIEPFVVDWKITNFFVNILRDTIDYRKKNNIVKHDFIDLMEELRNNREKIDDLELTDTFLAAQLFIFLMAGYESSANAISNCLYELAKNQALQDKVRDDINNELAKSHGKLTYESVKSMKYLNMVFQETLRMYAPSQIFVRQSVQQYTFAGTKSTIPAGTKVIIPLFAIHRDPRIFPKPEVFDPERFTDEAIKSRHSMSWMGFGEGPRQCIAFQFATYQTKIGLIKILQRYKVEVCEKTQIPYIINPTAFILTPKHGIHVKISKIV